jgi:hypothetical protein
VHDIPPREPDTRHPLAQQAKESAGKIKQPQRTGATTPEKDLARGSEPATHGTNSRRQ